MPPSHFPHLTPNFNPKASNMLTAQSPLTVDKKLRPKSGRKPLQPKNPPANPITDVHIPKPKQHWVEVSANKESHRNPIYAAAVTPTKLIETLASSLAEELSSTRKKMERLSVEKERTEKMLREREMLLDLEMKELEKRGEVQRRLEMEVDRLYRLKELHSYSLRISPIRSLREKEHERKISGVHYLQEMKAEDLEESGVQNALQSPGQDQGPYLHPSPSSSWSSNSISSPLVVVK